MQNSGVKYELWAYREDALTEIDITNFKVEGRDGEDLGTVHEATRETGASYLVVRTGIWFFSKKVMLPAGVIDRIDLDTETVYVDVTQREIEQAPEFDEATFQNAAYRDQLGTYYGSRSR
jgi:PRC-barrel domain